MKLLSVMCLPSLGFVLMFGQNGLAADSASSFHWPGPSIGAHIGYAWGYADTSFSPLPAAARFSDLAPTTLSRIRVGSLVVYGPATIIKWAASPGEYVLRALEGGEERAVALPSSLSDEKEKPQKVIPFKALR